MRALKYLWASPYTAFGWLVGLTSLSLPIRVDGVWWFEVERGPAKAVFRWLKAGAMTYGHVVVATIPVNDRVFRHEMIHVRQYERWGPLFLPAYYLAMLDGGQMNRFEREAYKHQDDPTYVSRGRGKMTGWTK